MEETKVFKLHEIREIIRLIDGSNIQEFELDHEGSKLTLKKEPKGVVTNFGHKEQPMFVEQRQVVPQVSEESQAQSAPMGSYEKPEVIDKNLHQVKSPMVGTFYKSPTPDADPYVKLGDKVDDKTVVCIIEAMKLFNEIEAEVAGEIVEILVENGQLVEYGQPLFIVRK